MLTRKSTQTQAEPLGVENVSEFCLVFSLIFLAAQRHRSELPLVTWERKVEEKHVDSRELPLLPIMHCSFHSDFFLVDAERKIISNTGIFKWPTERISITCWKSHFISQRGNQVE